MVPRRWAEKRRREEHRVAAVVTLVICNHALRYLSMMVDPQASLAPASDVWFLREWIWKFGIAAAFGEMALHYAVRSVRAFMPSVELEDPTTEPLT